MSHVASSSRRCRDDSRILLNALTRSVRSGMPAWVAFSNAAEFIQAHPHSRLACSSAASSRFPKALASSKIRPLLCIDTGFHGVSQDCRRLATIRPISTLPSCGNLSRSTPHHNVRAMPPAASVRVPVATCDFQTVMPVTPAGRPAAPASATLTPVSQPLDRLIVLGARRVSQHREGIEEQPSQALTHRRIDRFPSSSHVRYSRIELALQPFVK